MTNKQSLIFMCSLTTTTFSLLGWLCVSYLSPNLYIWWISVPIMIFIATVDAYLLTEALERNKDDR